MENQFRTTEVAAEDNQSQKSPELIGQRGSQKLKRNLMHTLAINQWLQKRHKTTTKKSYLYFPEEMMTNLKIKRIFDLFDTSKNRKLQAFEFRNMFNRFNLNIEIEDLEPIFQYFNTTGSKGLTYSEFKMCLQSPKCNAIFAQIMQKAQQRCAKQVPNGKNEQKKTVYYPTTFQAVVNHITYEITRDFIQQQISEQELKHKEHKVGPEKVFEGLVELLQSSSIPDERDEFPKYKKEQKLGAGDLTESDSESDEYESDYEGEDFDQMQQDNSPIRKSQHSSSNKSSLSNRKSENDKAFQAKKSLVNLIIDMQNIVNDEVLVDSSSEEELALPEIRSKKKQQFLQNLVCEAKEKGKKECQQKDQKQNLIKNEKQNIFGLISPIKTDFQDGQGEEETGQFNYDKLFSPQTHSSNYKNFKKLKEWNLIQDQKYNSNSPIQPKIRPKQLSQPFVTDRSTAMVGSPDQQKGHSFFGSSFEKNKVLLQKQNQLQTEPNNRTTTINNNNSMSYLQKSSFQQGNINNCSNNSVGTLLSKTQISQTERFQGGKKKKKVVKSPNIFRKFVPGDFLGTVQAQINAKSVAESPKNQFGVHKSNFFHTNSSEDLLKLSDSVKQLKKEDLHCLQKELPLLKPKFAKEEFTLPYVFKEKSKKENTDAIPHSLGKITQRTIFQKETPKSFNSNSVEGFNCRMYDLDKQKKDRLEGLLNLQQQKQQQVEINFYLSQKLKQRQNLKNNFPLTLNFFKHQQNYSAISEEYGNMQKLSSSIASPILSKV